MSISESFYKLLLIKYFDLKDTLPSLEMRDLITYLKKVILRNVNINSVNEFAFYVMNIRINKLIEYLSVNAILDDSSSIEDDFNEIMKG